MAFRVACDLFFAAVLGTPLFPAFRQKISPAYCARLSVRERVRLVAYTVQKIWRLDTPSACSSAFGQEATYRNGALRRGSFRRGDMASTERAMQYRIGAADDYALRKAMRTEKETGSLGG